MRRIATNMPNDDLQFRLRRHEAALSSLQTKMATQNRITDLREDPLAAARAVRYDSYLTRLERYERNALYAESYYTNVDGYLGHSQEVLQRIREIAVQGANGVYSQEDQRYMGVEVDQLLRELVQTANADGPDGTRLFAGDRAYTEPFRVVEGDVAGAGESVIKEVVYQGAGASRNAEVAEGAYAELDLSGGEVFWAEKMKIISSLDASTYRVPSASIVRVDGYDIQLNMGDSVQSIAAKINDSAAPVKAAIDPDTGGLVLEGTNAHLIRLEDGPDSKVFVNLGLIKSVPDSGTPNWSPAAQVSGASTFDAIIRLRDALFSGDAETVGGTGLAGIDFALDNLNARRTELGSRHERVSLSWRRLNAEIPDVTANLAREASLDFAEAATDLSSLEFAHKAALQTAAKLIQPTLLDYLK